MLSVESSHFEMSTLKQAWRGVSLLTEFVKLQQT